jgi:hypothetical protein
MKIHNDDYTTMKTPNKIVSLILCCMLWACFAGCSVAEDKKKQTAEQPAPSGPLFHREPLLPGKFAMMPMGSVKPRGWLKKQLKIQAESLVGRRRVLSDAR